MLSWPRTLAAAFALACLFQTSLPGETAPVELRWNELGSMVAGHNVTLTLREGGTVSGEAMAVRENELVLDVHRATARGYKKGNGAIPRDSVALIKLERSRGGLGRTVGTAIGVISGLTLGAYAAAHTNSAGAGIPAFLAIASGLTVTGSYAGRQFDHKTTLIRIVP